MGSDLGQLGSWRISREFRDEVKATQEEWDVKGARITKVEASRIVARRAERVRKSDNTTKGFGFKL